MSKKDLFFILSIVIGILAIILFNYIIDPYYIFKAVPIEGINDKKPHLYTNKRQIIFSDMKLNGRYKIHAFLGDCALYRTADIPYNSAFYSVPVTNISEIKSIIMYIKKYIPGIKTLYFGLNFNEIAGKDRKTDELSFDVLKKSKLNEIIGLLFSWNTTKYSFETLKASVLYKKNPTEYVYPYRETAGKKYTDITDESIDEKIKEIEQIKEYAKENDFKLTFYFAPSNITYKIYLYKNNVYDKYNKLKKQLALVSDYCDYSLNNEYNTEILDGTGIYYIDTLHITPEFDNIIINDLVSGCKKTGILINKGNVSKIIETDTKYLKDYVNTHKEYAEKIGNLKTEDEKVRIKRIKPSI